MGLPGSSSDGPGTRSEQSSSARPTPQSTPSRPRRARRKQQSASTRPGQRRREELPGDVAREQVLAVLRDRSRRPHRVVHAQVHESARQQAVLELLDEHAFAAHRVARLQQATRNSCSGGTGRRPVCGKMASNCGDSWRSASSVIWRIARSGWSAGTRCSGER